ncbi:hypothetical protein JOM56_002533 [Amanita muscaria]
MRTSIGRSLTNFFRKQMESTSNVVLRRELMEPPLLSFSVTMYMMPSRAASADGSPALYLPFRAESVHPRPLASTSAPFDSKDEAGTAWTLFRRVYKGKRVRGEVAFVQSWSLKGCVMLGSRWTISLSSLSLTVASNETRRGIIRFSTTDKRRRMRGFFAPWTIRSPFQSSCPRHGGRRPRCSWIWSNPKRSRRTAERTNRT